MATYIGCIGTLAHGRQVTSLLCKMTSSCEIVSQRIQGLLGAYFEIKKQWRARKRIHDSCEGKIEKSIPLDHHFFITRQAS